VAVKQQASGWPEGCETDEQKQAFIAEFERVEGVLLELTLIENNPALRQIAKTLLNRCGSNF
jgi:hypothetical protein